MKFNKSQNWYLESDEDIDLLTDDDLDTVEDEEQINEADDTFEKDIKEIIRYTNAAYGKTSDNKKKLDFWSKKYTATYNAIKPFSLSKLSDGSYAIELSTNGLDFNLLENVLASAVKSKGLSKPRKTGMVGNKYFIYESV